jgi:hypothetical protein
MKEVMFKTKRDRVRGVKKLIVSVKNQIGSVWFKARGTGKLRKMAYRLRVSHPQYEKVPEGNGIKMRRDCDLITVFDCNTLRYNRRGMLNGRGGYKSIPLDGVVRLKVGGEIYRIR